MMCPEKINIIFGSTERTEKFTRGCALSLWQVMFFSEEPTLRFVGLLWRVMCI